ncbi:MAG: tRNA (adenosine(37)-N6)-threonylcarbamoyltransferase complex dimerization subunit type 1 TsaB [Firmicutes bacterium]|nr:tRNA (adenosine(37)-N6)-threonylcarbamoyltransferase complex dimerization subunit type 1 TsaB [Bacillota bacterium]MCL5971325.1 tRNA (adenosine(37)-N6)-threonylcarbamoyltransferase complex dimerization subunit type 1 TsaB [Bacillota bacterium]
MKILGLDASGPALAVGLVVDTVVAADFMWTKPRTAGSHLIAWVQQIVEQWGRPNAIAVGIGPGSFTGVRIAVTGAKALAYAWDIPVKGVSSLQAWAMNAPRGSQVLVTTELRGPAFYAGYYRITSQGPEPLIADQAINGALPSTFPTSEMVYVAGPLAESTEGLRRVGIRATPLPIALMGSCVALLGRKALIEGRADTPELLAPFYGRPPAITTNSSGSEQVIADGDQ